VGHGSYVPLQKGKVGFVHRIDAWEQLLLSIHTLMTGSKEPKMTKRFGGAVALMLALFWNAATAQPSDPAWDYYQHASRCMAWDGYRWLNMCWRSRTFVHPTWARFQR